MKNFLLISLFLLLSVSSVIAQTSTRNAPGLYIQDEDGTNAARYRRLKFPNNVTTNNGDGSVSIDIAKLATSLCELGVINCIYDTISNCPDTDRCFVYNTSSKQLWLYVNNEIQIKYPSTAAVQDKLLLEASFGGGTDSILIEGGATDVLLQE